MEFFLKGGVLGFSIAAPVGPIGVLCIRRSITEGRAMGFLSGLGAATADAVYGLVAAAGLTAISGFLVRQQFWFGLIGGLFLCWLGAQTFRAKPAEQSAKADAQGLLSAYGSTFLLTLTNPLTILSFAAMFAGAGLGGAAGSVAAASLVVAGVFTGSALWWLLLSLIAGALRGRFDRNWQRWLNRLSGIVIATFGFWHLSKLALR
ncbi:MAG TPA: LysE family transporter [Candidatus Limnocylindria bacterium]|jgi:threonine/homoserine/homoserine lactone efflux protein|nr:LysE family transporter [Candidatus Limnocylindria bacterium]